MSKDNLQFEDLIRDLQEKVSLLIIMQEKQEC